MSTSRHQPQLGECATVRRSARIQNRIVRQEQQCPTFVMGSVATTVQRALEYGGNVTVRRSARIQARTISRGAVRASAISSSVVLSSHHPRVVGGTTHNANPPIMQAIPFSLEFSSPVARDNRPSQQQQRAQRLHAIRNARRREQRAHRREAALVEVATRIR